MSSKGKESLFSFNLLAEGDKLVGDIKSDNAFRVNGIVEGQVVVKGRLIVGSSGSIIGDVLCAELVVFGEVNGNIESEDVVLKPGARVNGNVTYCKLHFEPGVFYTGYCNTKRTEKLSLKIS